MHPNTLVQPPNSSALKSRVRRLLAVPHAVIVTLALLYGIILGVVIPPLQSPDEAAHITQAAVLSHGVVFGKSADKTLPGGQIDSNLTQYFDLYDQLRKGPNKFTPALRGHGDALMHSGKTEFAATPATSYYLPIVYFPQAMALAIGRWVNLSVGKTIQLARAFAFLTSLAILYFAIRLYPPNMFVLTILFLPMFLFQVACSGIDGITTATAVFALGYFMRSMNTSWHPAAHLEFAFATALLVLCTTRQHLTPMLLLPFFLYFLRRERKLLALGLTLFILTLAWTLFAMDSTSSVAPSVMPTLKHYLAAPATALTITTATIFNLSNLRDYINAFIGILGWLDTPMQPWFYKIVGVFAIVSAGLSFSTKSTKTEWAARGFLLVLSVTSSALVFLIMMVVWTKLPASHIEGVQGRYFFVPALMFAYGLSGANIAWQYRRMKIGLLCVFMLLTTSNTIYIIVDWHYSATPMLSSMNN